MRFAKWNQQLLGCRFAHTGFHHAGFHGSINVAVDEEVAVGEHAAHCAIVVASGIFGIVFLQCIAHRHDGAVVGFHHAAAAIAVGITLRISHHGQRCRLIGGALHLGDIPVGGEVTEVHHAHVGAIAFHLLQIPQREGVVVAIGEDNGVFVEARQIVHTKVVRTSAIRAVVVVPCLAHHLQGHQQTNHRCHTCHCL